MKILSKKVARHGDMGIKSIGGKKKGEKTRRVQKKKGHEREKNATQGRRGEAKGMKWPVEVQNFIRKMI